MYQAHLTPTANKRLKKLPQKIQKNAIQAIRRLCLNPTLGKPLRRELKSYWKLRFSKYRIIYLIKKKQLIIVIVDIDHRKDIYR